jgi:RimJ/RimL family protein N-acetyltransferase
MRVLTDRTEPRRTSPPTRLERFDPRHTELVASWVRSEREAYWLAPHTPPPITAERVLAWSMEGRHPLQLMEGGALAPVAYGELNVLNASAREYWLGHLIVDPERRGRGLGVRLVELLIQRGFQHLGARRISLVVFTDNLVAQRSYRAAGMREEGYEVHRFPAYGTSERLLRMGIEDWM